MDRVLTNQNNHITVRTADINDQAQGDSLYFHLIPYNGAGDYVAQPIGVFNTAVTATLHLEPGLPDLQSVHLPNGSVTVANDLQGGTVDATGSVPLNINTELKVHVTGTWSCPG
jgi:hypothetical protein